MGLAYLMLIYLMVIATTQQRSYRTGLGRWLILRLVFHLANMILSYRTSTIEFLDWTLQRFGHYKRFDRRLPWSTKLPWGSTKGLWRFGHEGPNRSVDESVGSLAEGHLGRPNLLEVRMKASWRFDHTTKPPIWSSCSSLGHWAELPPRPQLMLSDHLSILFVFIRTSLFG